MNINTDRLRSLLGSEEAAQKFVSLFRQQLPGQLEALRKSLAEKRLGNRQQYSAWT